MKELKFRIWSKRVNQYIDIDTSNYDFSLNELFYELQKNHVVQQFTGFKDSKGNEVWEGDVVRIIYEGKIAEVYFDYNLGSFRLKDTNGKSYPITTYRFDESGNLIGLINVFDEVIGTVFDNE